MRRGWCCASLAWWTSGAHTTLCPHSPCMIYPLLTVPCALCAAQVDVEAKTVSAHGSHSARTPTAPVHALFSLTTLHCVCVLQVSVELRQYPKTHPFAGTQFADNICAFSTERYAPQPLVIQGPGAGAAVTAAGIFSDLIKVAKAS
jgi:hypothetical protein